MLTPHKLFSKLTPTRQILALRVHRGRIASAAISDPYLSFAYPLASSSELFRNVKYLSPTSKAMPAALFEMKTKLDVGGVLILISAQSQHTDDDSLSKTVVDEAVSQGILVSQWQAAQAKEFVAPELREIVSCDHDFKKLDIEALAQTLDHDTHEMAAAFGLASYIHDVVGGWANSFG
jgi:hypothetical protein